MPNTTCNPFDSASPGIYDMKGGAHTHFEQIWVSSIERLYQTLR